MIAGIVFIICGLLIAFFPPLLSIIVATVLIIIGIAIAMAAYEFRRKGFNQNSNVISFIIRH